MHRQQEDGMVHRSSPGREPWYKQSYFLFTGIFLFYLSLLPFTCAFSAEHAADSVHSNSVTASRNIDFRVMRAFRPSEPKRWINMDTDVVLDTSPGSLHFLVIDLVALILLLSIPTFIFENM